MSGQRRPARPTPACLAVLLAAGAALAGADRAQARPFTDPRSDRLEAIEAGSFATAPRDPACVAVATVSTGGAAPRDPHTLAVRWLGVSNFELAYGGQVILLDAYYDRGSLFPPLGFKPADVKRADAILIGHGHFDHMSDAASVGAQTGALVVGASVTTEKLLTQPIAPQQVRTVSGRGGEVIKFDHVMVEPILARHGEPPRAITQVIDRALETVTPGPSPEQQAERAAIRSRGTSDPRVIAEGTIAYLIRLDDGFRIMYRDSGGAVTDYERAAMAGIGRVDLALVAVAADTVEDPTVAMALTHLQTYRPDVLMPAHHDSPPSLWRATEPLFQAMKEADPDLVTVSREYREPVCFNTEVNRSRQP
jgi:L-ascorbate metabolism protein UlaG (beta-lactamase superfamily)